MAKLPKRTVFTSSVKKMAEGGTTSEDIEANVLRDYSGNDNLGFVIGDYKPKFDDKTLQPKVVKTYAKLASSKLNGAF